MFLELCRLSQLSATPKRTHVVISSFWVGTTLVLDVNVSVVCVSTVVEPIFKSRHTFKLL